ncbi:hypothetical protein LIER_38219 [Lithospermum erythrorhizon]|uniref:Uncharacterized protein n=1 Tax=Lithospermum erythrorhizon TaxID=34254 RepID=A0AAV3PYD3_LITER
MLSKIGRYVGNLFFTDGATSDLDRLSYGRIYVEVEAAKELPEFVPLFNENGIEFRQKIEYEWIRSMCSHCNLFEHSLRNYSFGTIVNVKNGFAVLDDDIDDHALSKNATRMVSKGCGSAGKVIDE